MDTLYGRMPEIELLRGLVANARVQGDSLVIAGEPGIGKSALVAVATAMALDSGFRVLATTGVQSEAELPFAGLHHMMRAAPGDVDSLPGPQRDAMLAAFGRYTATAPDLFLIALATLELLSDAAAQSPLLLVAEDVQWLDRATCDVLTFVARRLDSEPIVMLFAIRADSQSAVLKAGLKELHVEALAEQHAAALLAARAPHLPTDVRREILEAARGNPLALEELPVSIGAAGMHDGASSATSLKLTSRLEKAFIARFDELPTPTRAALLVAAVNDGLDVDETLDGAGRIWSRSITIADLMPAVEAHLVEIDQSELRFRHPLVRSAISQNAGLADRMAAHAALAETLDAYPDRRAWHRAASVIGRDEDAAAELIDVADHAKGRGAAIVAVNALERASTLTPDPLRRLERLLRASELAFEVGRRDLVARLVREAEPLTTLAQGPIEQARLTLVRGWGEGVPADRRVDDLLSLAERARAAGDADVAWHLLWRLAQRCFWADPGPDARLAVARAARSMPDDPRRVAVLAYATPLEAGNEVIEVLSRAQADDLEAEAARFHGIAAVVVGAFELSAQFLTVATTGLRDEGRLAHLARTLAMQGWSATCLGNWQFAVPTLDEAVRLAGETGERAWVAGAQAMQATLAALLGDPDRALALALEAERTVISIGATHMLAYVQVARGLTALGDGRYADAYAELHRIYDPVEPAHHDVPSAWYIGDLAEAAAYSGHRDEARSAMERLQPLVEGTRSSWTQAGIRLARAHLAGDEEADELFREALASDLGPWPFQRGRLLLGYGVSLRRRRRASEARTHLRAARDIFDALGAVQWADRARRELRAAGEASRKREREAWDRLSPQEIQIARMAAEGMSNREIGQKLYLSHRTVGSHLYRIFPKLGITSRGQLTAALARS